MSRSFKVFLSVVGGVLLLTFLWLFLFSPITWGLRAPRNGKECILVSHTEHVEGNNLYCDYKGKSYYYNYLGATTF